MLTNDNLTEIFTLFSQGVGIGVVLGFIPYILGVGIGILFKIMKMH